MNAIILSDPAFLQEFLTVFIIVLGVVFSAIETGYLRIFTKYESIKTFASLLQAHFMAIGGTVLLMLFVFVPIVGNFIKEGPPVVELFAWGYFAVLTMYVGFLAKRRQLLKQQPQLDIKKLRIPLIASTILLYGIWWWMVYTQYIAR